jgi:hypothetical protein
MPDLDRWTPFTDTELRVLQAGLSEVADPSDPDDEDQVAIELLGSQIDQVIEYRSSPLDHGISEP